MKLDAILPAGGRLSGDFAAEAGVEVKALISFEGRTVLERTLSVLRATGAIERTVVVGPDEVISHEAVGLADQALAEGESGPENIMRGLRWLQQSNGGAHADKVLILTTDLPLITPESLTLFLEACPPEADLCVPVITREAYEERFPGSRNEFLKLSDGEWTMGCSFLIDPTVVVRNLDRIENVFEARKSQARMASLLGSMFVLKYLTGHLSIADIKERCLSLLGCSGNVILHSPPELAFDIDLPEEYRYALRHFNAVSETK